MQIVRRPRTMRCRHTSPIDMTHPRTRCIVHFTAALPDLEAQLVLLTAPNIQTLIVTTQFPKEFRTYGKQPTGHNWTPEGSRWMLQIIGQQWQSFVVELPIEGATSSLILSTIFKCVVRYNVDEGTHAHPVVLGDWICIICMKIRFVKASNKSF